MKRTQTKRELKLQRKEIRTLHAPDLENVVGGCRGIDTGGSGGNIKPGPCGGKSSCCLTY